jgi:hypothetical protein
VHSVAVKYVLLRMGETDKDALARLIEAGGYTIDPHEVAAAMLSRRPSMFEAVQPLDRPVAGVEEDEPASGADLA